MCFISKSSRPLYFLRSIFVTANVLLVIKTSQSQTVPADRDLTVTWAEKQVMDQLTIRVQNNLTQDYMRDEAYLINWVRAGHNDLNKAEDLLRKNLIWRKEYGMDAILYEKFEYMEAEYPLDLKGEDISGKPVLAVNVGEWDMRKLHISGKVDENYRYCMQALERASELVRKKQANGELVTRFHVIWNFEGFSLEQHGCLQCIPPYIRFISAFQRYFPGMVDNVIFINAPSFLEAVLRAVRPVAGGTLRSSMRIFGTNEIEWKQYVFSFISPDQLDKSMGGMRVDTN